MSRDLTSAEMAARRTERALLLVQLAELAPMQRRLKHITREIVDGKFYPSPGVAPEQLTLDDRADPLADAAEAAAAAAAAAARPSAPKAEDLRTRVTALLERSKVWRSSKVLAMLLSADKADVRETCEALVADKIAVCQGKAYKLASKLPPRPARKTPKAAAKAPEKASKPAPKKPAPQAPRPTKTIRETKPRILDGYTDEMWEEGLHSVAGLISSNGKTRGAWLLLHARPNASVAAEVLDLLAQAELIIPGETIKIGAVLEADEDAQPGVRFSHLITKRVGQWVCDLVASSAKPPTVDKLAQLTGVHRGLWCALLNGLESEGVLRRSKGRGVPVWEVVTPPPAGEGLTSAQKRTKPLFPGVQPVPAPSVPEVGA